MILLGQYLVVISQLILIHKISMKAKVLPSYPKIGGQTVSILPRSKSEPYWLLRLCVLQRQVAVVTFVLVAAMLTIYGCTVYSEQKWNQTYRKLVTLLRHERQLTTTNEVLKNQMAVQAEQPGTELVQSNPSEVLFLQPLPQPPNRTAITAASKPSAPFPLGY